MALSPIGTQAEPQLIPTNAGLRTFATPPLALQENIVPNDLFYVRNHWKDCPVIDINTYRLTVDGEVERPLSLSYEDLKKLGTFHEVTRVVNSWLQNLRGVAGSAGILPAPKKAGGTPAFPAKADCVWLRGRQYTVNEDMKRARNCLKSASRRPTRPVVKEKSAW